MRAAPPRASRCARGASSAAAARWRRRASALPSLDASPAAAPERSSDAAARAVPPPPPPPVTVPALGDPPLVLYEDAHVLAVHKPAGWNTHRSDALQPGGVFDWLRGREPRWAGLSIHSRLDRETSGVLLFGLSAAANRGLAAAYAAGSPAPVSKVYTLLCAPAAAAARGRGGGGWAPPGAASLASLRGRLRGAAAAALALSDAGDGWLRVESGMVRVGDRYAAVAPPPSSSTTHVAGAAAAPAPLAVTLFRPLPGPAGPHHALEAVPVTGKTHQIRVHAAALGWPLVGDRLYGGRAAGRLHLHAARLTLAHPATGEALALEAPQPPGGGPDAAGWGVARATVGPRTSFYRAAPPRLAGDDDGDEYDDGGAVSAPPPPPPPQQQQQQPRWRESARRPPPPPPLTPPPPAAVVDVLGAVAVVSCAGPPPPGLGAALLGAETLGGCGLGPVAAVYHRPLRRDVRRTGGGADPSLRPALIAGNVGARDCDGAPLVVEEHGVRYRLSLGDGYSVGLFADQRDNRRRLLAGYAGPPVGFLLPPPPPAAAAAAASGCAPPRPELLNVFAYTCGFSLCAALGGWRATSLDLSKRYLEWGKCNFVLNGLDPAAHDWVYGDAADWLARFCRKGRTFGCVMLDPPTFSTGFRAERDYAALAASAARLLARGGLLFCSTNAARVAPADFDGAVRAGVALAGRRVAAALFEAQAPDHLPRRADEPAYLKTLWLRLD